MEADKCAECGCELDGPDEGETLIEATNVVLLCPDCHSNLTERKPVDFFDWIKLRVEPEEREERII